MGWFPWIPQLAGFTFLIPCYQRAGVIVQNVKKWLCAVEPCLRTVENILPQVGLKLKTTRSVGKHLTHRATWAPQLLFICYCKTISFIFQANENVC